MSTKRHPDAPAAPASPAREALIASIEALYQAFARYPIGPSVEGCPCCVSPDDARTLARAPLRKIEGALLERYALKAMTTWGSEADLRHFVPAIWERMTLGRFGIDPQIVYGKLAMAGVLGWREEEQVALARVTERWLDACVEGERDDGIDVVIESAGCAGLAVAPLIERLDRRTALADPAAADALAALLRRLGGRDEMGWSFWRDDPGQLLARFVRAEARPRIERAFFAHPDHPGARSWSDALDGW